VDGCERDPARATLVNGDGTRNVADACAAAGAPLVYVSTDYVFDGRKDGPWVETDPTHPLSAYGRSKLAGEEHVRERVRAWTIVRSQSIYGAGKKSFVDSVVARADAGGELAVVTDQTVSPTWAEDLAEALAAGLQAGVRGLYLVANAGACTWHECARAALDLTGHARVPIREILAAELARPAPRPANSAFDCSRFERDAGVRLRPWRDALAGYLRLRGGPKEER
jgi:dTDP-4-dehydrorhamnose reductase